MSQLSILDKIMLSQFKHNLHQAISCILIHQQNLRSICNESIDPLQPYLQKILPLKLRTSFNSISAQKTYQSIDDFFNNLEEIQNQANQQQIQYQNNNSLVKQNSSVYIKNNIILNKRKTNHNALRNSFEGYIDNNNSNNHNQSRASVFNQKQISQIIFKQYRKLDQGGKRNASFTQKQMFKETLNYHKIIRFLQRIKVKLVPDSRLKLLILIKKNSQDSNYVKKQQFKTIYKQMKVLLNIDQQTQKQYYNKYSHEFNTKSNLHSNKIDLRSHRRISIISRLPSINNKSNRSTIKINPQKLDIYQSFVEKERKKLRQQESNNSLLLNLQDKIQIPLQKVSLAVKHSLTNKRISRSVSKTNSITWINLAKTKQESLQNNKNIKTPHLELKVPTNQDRYYLDEFYKSNGLHEQILNTQHESQYQLSPYKSLAQDINNQQN